MPPKLLLSPEQPLLTAADLGPLEYDFLDKARSMLPPSLEDEARQIKQQQALGRFLKKGVQHLLFNIGASSDATTPLIESYYEGLATEALNPDFMQRLEADYDKALQAISANGQPPKWSRLFTGRKQRLAHQAEVAQHQEQRKAELAEIRNQTFEAHQPMISLDDLHEGETVDFYSQSRGAVLSEQVTSLISGVVLGHRLENQRGPILLLKINEETRGNVSKFIDPAKRNGIVVRLLGTGLVGKLLQGQTLHFLSTEGLSVEHGQYHKYNAMLQRYDNGSIALHQVTVNGNTKLFPPIDTSGKRL